MITFLLTVLFVGLLAGCAAQKGMEMTLKKDDGTELDISAGYEFTDGIEVDRDPSGALHIKAGSATVNESETGSMVIVLGMFQQMMQMMMQMYGMPVPAQPPPPE